MLRRCSVLVFIAILTIVPAGARAQTEPANVPTSRLAASEDWLYPTVLGFGAIAGLLVYNVATTGIFFRPPPAGSRVSFGDVAMSRVYTVASAVLGGWIANWLYNGQEYGRPHPYTS